MHNENSRVKPSELARELGVSRQAICDLQDRGILPRSEDGLIDIDVARRAIAQKVALKGKTAAAVHTDVPQPPPKQPAQDTPPPPAVDPEMNFYIAKAMRETAEARMSQLRLEQMQGNLVDRKRVELAAANAGRMLRDAILGVPTKLAPELTAISDAWEIERRMQTALRQVLDDASRIASADLAKVIEK